MLISGLELGEDSLTVLSKLKYDQVTDINECLYDPCSENELCFNQLGSYECLATPCPANYRLEDQ